MNICEKISAIMREIQYLAKDDMVEFGSTRYKALSEEKVTTVMREQLLKHNLVVYPISQAASRVGNITHVDVVYRLVNVEDPGEYIEIASCGDGADSQDKDNVSSFGRKVIQDALVRAGILHNDGWADIDGFSDEFYVDKANPRVEVEIYERNG